MSPRKTRIEVVGDTKLVQDKQTVTPDGDSLASYIEGVQEKRFVTQMDERGSLCEMFNPAWNFDAGPLAYVYQASLLPGFVKGWVLHFEQDDRLFLANGRIRVVLFDGRKQSPTHGMINKFEGGDVNRCLIRIPAGVYHAVQNIGSQEAFYYNLPTKPYRHENPDKFRLPLENDIIPYHFKGARGW